MTRQEANMELLHILESEIEFEPDLRFSQILYNLGFVIDVTSDGLPCGAWEDEHHLESEELLKRVKEK